MVLNKNDKYNHSTYKQAGKNSSIAKSKNLVKEIQEMFRPFLKECEEYEPSIDLRINKAPAVRLPSGKLAIAPDLKCVTHDDKVFWIEVKDKAQRVFFPDTGADLHQVLGWYDINKYLNEPVLVIFKDPAYESCLPKNSVSEDVIDRFKRRWNKFSGSYYGNWLDKLMQLDKQSKYPCIFVDERSRDLSMNILYFHINKMLKIENNVPFLLKNMPNDICNLVSFKRGSDKIKTLIEEEEDIRKLSF